MSSIEITIWGDFKHLRKFFSKPKAPDESFLDPPTISPDEVYEFQQIVSVIRKDDGKFLEDVATEDLKGIVKELKETHFRSRKLAAFYREEAERLKDFERFIEKLLDKEYRKLEAQRQLPDKG